MKFVRLGALAQLTLDRFRLGQCSGGPGNLKTLPKFLFKLFYIVDLLLFFELFPKLIAILMIKLSVPAKQLERIGARIHLEPITALDVAAEVLCLRDALLLQLDKHPVPMVVALRSASIAQLTRYAGIVNAVLFQEQQEPRVLLQRPDLAFATALVTFES